MYSTDMPQHEIRDDRDRFAMITEAAFSHFRWNTSLTPSCLSVYVALLFRAGHHNRRCFPAIRKLALDSGVSHRTVITNLQLLQEAGLIRIEPRFSEDRQTTNVYTILNVAPHPDEEGYAKPSKEGATINRGEGEENNTPEGAKNNTPYNQNTNNKNQSEPYVLGDGKSPQNPEKPKPHQQPLRPVPEDFSPGDKLMDWCLDNGFTPAQVKEQVPQFIDHHTAKGTMLRDWSAGFRTWMRNARQWGKLGTPMNGHISLASPPPPALFDKNGNYTAAGLAAKARQMEEDEA